MIGEQTINAIGEAVTAALLDHMPELDQAYAQAEETLSVSVSVKLKPVPEGNCVDVGVAFVTSRVKTSVRRIVSERQMSMEFGGDDGD
jgi:hypothetical protein